MKFEELLMSEGRGRRLALQEEVEELQERLDGEVRVNKTLRRAMKLQYSVPLQLQLLLAELDTVEEEIFHLERALLRIHDPVSFPEHPNAISEELLRSLMAVFLTNQDQDHPPHLAELQQGLSSCIISSSSSSRARSGSNIIQNNAPPTYKGYTHITRASFSNLNTQLMPPISLLLKKLCHVDLALLNYKEKLAFWINVYNACIMNGDWQRYLNMKILEQETHPNQFSCGGCHTSIFNFSGGSTDFLFLIEFPRYQRMTMKNIKPVNGLLVAAVNVGGIVLNALAIEHYILRHPHDLKQDVEDKKEILLRRAYGLQYPEPNVTFALCRGNWSSPALKVYMAEDVVNELERAKVEYLEAWVGVRRRQKKIVLPKLVHWHMRDFADDLESLIEWIYSQLPHSGGFGLKTRMMDCLHNSNTKPITNMVEILPYQYEFRYLMPTPLHKSYESTS